MLSGFSNADRLFAFVRGFNGLTGLLNFFTQQMSNFSKDVIMQGFFNLIDDILPISNSKPHLLQFIEQLHHFATKQSDNSYWKIIFHAFNCKLFWQWNWISDVKFNKPISIMLQVPNFQLQKGKSNSWETFVQRIITALTVLDACGYCSDLTLCVSLGYSSAKY